VSEGSRTSTRLLSFTEISKALSCQAQWDFAYGGHLAGSALSPKMVAPRLSGGRAWGAAVAAFHTEHAAGAAIEAMDRSLDSDAAEQKDLGVYDGASHKELRLELLHLLNHYVHIAEPWDLDPQLERELLIPIPSRTGVRSSNRYKLLCYLDGTRQINGQHWIVEFKLRGALSSVEQIALSRQIRYYAWAWWQATGIMPTGVEVHEKLNQVPKPPRMVQGRKRTDAPLVPSHAKDQLCTAEAYEDACAEHEVEVNEATLESLKTRKWHQVVPIIFRAGELEEAGRELVSAAQLIQDLDSGKLWPVRNAWPGNCRGCFFREICPAPDNDLVDALYIREPPKREREEHASPST